jgi:tRNA nucleotidyltransferase/poly(A) polymerase
MTRMTTTIPAITPALRGVLAAVHKSAPDAHLVGGAVRDLLDGRQPVDVDTVTARDARAVAGSLAAALGGSPFPLDEERKTWRVVLREGTGVDQVDISTIEQGIEADLRRRDFTIDALAAPVLADGSLGPVIDPCGGLDGLRDRCLRMVSKQGLSEDPLRLLRAVRLSVELTLSLEEETAAAVKELAPRLPETAPERQRDELVRMLATPRAAAGVRLMDDLGLLDVLIPELAPARGVAQPARHHYYDVFDHSIETLAALDVMLAESPQPGERAWLAATLRAGLGGFSLDPYLDERCGATSHRVLIKLAGLLHDVAKPETRSLAADGRVRFLGHPEQGSVKAARICARLRLGGKETAFVARLVEEHLRPTQLGNEGLPTRRALFRYFRDLGEAAPACLLLALGDAAGAAGPRLRSDSWQDYVAYMGYVLDQGLAQKQEIAARPRLVSGSDLIRELGLAPGPAIGRALAAIEEAVADGEVSTREQALALARRVAASASGAAPTHDGRADG